ncbi:MAG: hypothetical protein QMD66_06705 [Actinomycetota bacterium]|nr:hypothetical protein [Actinomycetota bacterium]NPV54532.1 hypothetical protein [Bacillota bacterium]
MRPGGDTILPPEPLLAAIEFLYVLASGTRRHDLYELTGGCPFRLSRRRAERSGLVKNDQAFQDLCDLDDFLDRLGRRILSGGDWRKMIRWEAIKGLPENY